LTITVLSSWGALSDEKTFWIGVLSPPPHSLLLRETLADSIANTFWNSSISYTTAASTFVTAETAVKVFIPVVTVYYLRVAA
jgi:hypothetical protein